MTSHEIHYIPVTIQSAGETLASNDNYLWGTPTGYQAPRSVRLSMSYDF